MAFVSRHVLEPLIERKPLISEECMLVYKVSNFYINTYTHNAYKKQNSPSSISSV